VVRTTDLDVHTRGSAGPRQATAELAQLLLALNLLTSGHRIGRLPRHFLR
jgi:hypothetical protein